MNKFCTTCGAAMEANSAFCTSCGTRVANQPVQRPPAPGPAEPIPAPAATVSPPMGEPTINTAAAPPRKRWPKVVGCVLLFLLGVLLGWWLAHKNPQCGPPPKLAPGNGTASPSGGAGEGGGSPEKLGKGGGAGGGGSLEGSGGSTQPNGSGHGGRADGDGDLSGGGAGGGGGADDVAKGGAPTGEPKLGEQVTKLARGGALGIGPDQDGPPAKDSSSKALVAPDFTYDKTGLPRYPDSVQKVASAQAFDQGDSGPFGSSVAITTGDDFDKVVAWYQSQMPSGWKSQTVGDFAGMANKLRGLMPGTADTPTPPELAGGDKIQLSIFTPPAGATGNPGVMIVKKGDQPVTVMMKAHLSDPAMAGKAPGSG